MVNFFADHVSRINGIYRKKGSKSTNKILGLCQKGYQTLGRVYTDVAGKKVIVF